LFQGTQPFWRDCFRGRLGIEDVRRWALDVNPVVRDFSHLYLQVAAKCTDERVLTFLATTIYEETCSGVEADSHPTLFSKFMRAIGIAKEDIRAPATTAAGRTFHEFAWTTVHEGWFLVGLGIERPLPAFFAMLARAFQRDLDLTDAAVRYFAVHTVADVKHSQLAARIVSERATTATDQDIVRRVLLHLWNLQQAQLDELHAAGRPAAQPTGAKLSPVASQEFSR
jgi:pyrroloquinoline quinone (PQQ) biosynthesis protein C